MGEIRIDHSPLKQGKTNISSQVFLHVFKIDMRKVRHSYDFVFYNQKEKSELSNATG